MRTRLPAELERLRQRLTPDAADGLPAHLTLLYPFVAPAALDAGLRRVLARVAAEVPQFTYRVVGQATFPDTVYAAVEPEEGFVRLQSALAVAFPDYPIYGQVHDFVYVPHVTVAEGQAVADSAVRQDAGWRTLPVDRRATALEVIARPGSRPWRVVWRISLSRLRPEAAG